MRRNLSRWRLILGAPSASAFEGAADIGCEDRARDAALNWLYERDGLLDERDIRRSGGLGPSQLSVPKWIGELKRLFPRETIERLERDAVQEFGIFEIVTQVDALSRIEPSPTLLRAVLLTKHLMNQEVLALARELVRKVVEQLMQRLAKEVRQAFSGAKIRRRSYQKIARNFDPLGTIVKNLSTYDVDRRQLFIKTPLFFSRSKRQSGPWQIILLVDESASMVGSVIHAAVTAACLWGIPSVKTHLLIFDTQVVDLTGHVQDPVETLMKVQLGGGTDIGRAVRFAASIVENPQRALVVLITDLYEGADPTRLVQSVKQLHEQGSKVLVLAALDDQAEPSYDRALGKRLARVGAHVGAMTPGQLVNYLHEVLS